MIVHHPAPELLTAFSAGCLPMSHALGIGVHMEYCPDCNANVKRLNNLGAYMLEGLQPAPVSDELRNNVFSLLDDTAAPDNPTPAVKSTHIHHNTPRCLHQFIPEDYDSLQWKRLSPSIATIKLCTDNNGAKVEMIRIKPGGKIATHTHTGDEFTVVLDGSFSDESGVYRDGDFVFRDERHKHSPIATTDAPCICLTVTDAPIAFTGIFTRWLNTFLK